MGTLADVLEPLGRPIRTTRPDATVLEAVEEMCRWHVRDLVIGDATDPVGCTDRLEAPRETAIVNVAPTPFPPPHSYAPQPLLL